ncbi:hypothetical protein PYW07_017458 [Mythimna separata]|uniref:Uncharacterized protein n=1 Tax=Mythimna separata TaxID=271217 RepID=A0AAD7YWP2_MYTSE|nr:hypothetical protein PYW07_017458 [Mythimna separata]
MIQLPKTVIDPKKTEHLCKCRPVCKSRRREWKGEIQDTSAELLLERQPPPSCFRRWPMEIYPNGPCPLFGRTRQVTVNERFKLHKPNVVRICQAPIEDSAETPYVQYAHMAQDVATQGAHEPQHLDHKLNVVRICQAPIEDSAETPYVQYAHMAQDVGAWGAVRACCAFCQCGACCPCGIREYVMHDAERAARRRSDMRSFDKRVKTDHQIMRIMYDKM